MGRWDEGGTDEEGGTEEAVGTEVWGVAEEEC